MRTRPANPRSGLTLIEISVCTAIGVTLSAMATVAFIQIQKTQSRLLTRLEMHNSARFLYQNMSESLSSLQQDGALWVETTADSGSGNGMVNLTFMRGKLDEHNFTTNSLRWWNGEGDAIYATRCTDLTWCRWQWNQHLQILSTGVCTPVARMFRVQAPWTGPTGNYGSNGQWFLNMPQPLRQAVPYPSATPIGSSAAALGGNRYGSADYRNDISDYQDLCGNLSPVLRNVSGFHLELLMADGSVVDADNTQSQTLGYDGNFVSAQCTPGADGIQPYLKRPVVVRLLIDMTDPQTQLKQSFAFSFRSASILPMVYGTGKYIP